MKEDDMSKKALLVISFGTSYPETRKKTIEATEDLLKEAYPDHDFYRAFTSKVIVRKLKKRDDLFIDSPKEALQKLKAAGYNEVICQTTHIINGHEYEKALKELKAFEDDFDLLKLGKPLLTSSEDYKKTMAILLKQIPPLKDDEALVLMGHGSYHHANSTYPCMDYIFKHHGHHNVYVATVEGFPELADIMPQLRKYRKIILLPFMLVAGDHAINDMASDDEDSWKSQLLKEGLEVEMLIKGMGECREIQELFLDHLRQAKSVKRL